MSNPIINITADNDSLESATFVQSIVSVTGGNHAPYFVGGTLDFESPLPDGLTPIFVDHSGQGFSLPTTSLITSQYADQGILMSGVGLVELGLGHAASGKNGLAGVGAGQTVDYNAPLTFTFVSLDGTTPTYTNYFEISGDQTGVSNNSVTITAYGADNGILDSKSYTETTTLPNIGISGVGNIYKVIVDPEIADTGNGGIGFDLVSITAPTTINYIDTPFVDSFATVTGRLVGSDVDADTALSYGIEGGIDNNNNTVSKSNAYGTLTVIKTRATAGVYSFVPNKEAIEQLSADATDTFTVTVSDGQLSDSETLTIHITQYGATESLGNDHLTGTSGGDIFNSLAGDDTIKGLAGDDVIDGGIGADTMIGGTGDDSYYVDNIGDVVTEYAYQGEDTVYTTVSYTLSPNVENIVLMGTAAITGTGNELNNHLTGNGAGSTLDGLGGDDNYYVSHVGDIIVESAGNGWDTVLSSIDYTLEDNIEELYLEDTGNLNGTGNAQDNNLNGNAGDNILDGGAGADFMVGHAGDDTYYVDNVGDVVKENTGEGVDRVYSSISYSLTANVEYLNLAGTAAINGTGNGLDNYLYGNDANNTLNGGAGDDHLSGGVGDDILRGGAGNDSLYGGEGNDVLQGGVGKDFLFGDEGADTLIGGLGQDIYDVRDHNRQATDTLRIATGDSLIGSYDKVSFFGLGYSMSTGTDKLDLDSTHIAANAAAVNGDNSGNIKSHHISDGIITFDDVNNYTNSLTITEANLANVFSYLQANITGHDTVAFVSESNTFVFQDGGVTDTLVELIGRTASSVNNTGLGDGAVWIV